MKLKSFYGLLGLFVLLTLAETLGRMGIIDARYFPFPSNAIRRLVQLIATNEDSSSGFFREHLAASAWRFSIGVILSVAISLVLTMASGISEISKRLSSAIIGFLYPLPKSAVFPLLLLVFGLNDGAHIALITIGSVAMMLATTLAGLQRLEAAGYMEVARILKLRPWITAKKILLPGLLPEFMHGIKLGASYALVLLLVGEMIVTRQGIGVFLWAAWDQFNILDLYAMFYLISVIGFLLFGVFDYLGERFSDSQRAV